MSRPGKRPRLDQEFEMPEAWYDPYANPPCDDNDWAVMPPPEAFEENDLATPPSSEPAFSRSEIASFEAFRIRAKLSVMVSALEDKKIKELLVDAMMSSGQVQAAVSAAYIEKKTRDIEARRVEQAQVALQRDSTDNLQQASTENLQQDSTDNFQREMPQQQGQRRGRQRGSRRRRGRGRGQAH